MARVDLHNFFQFYDERNPNHVKAVQWLEDNLPVEYLGDNVEWAEIYRGKKTSAFLPALRKIPHWSEMSDGKRGALLSFAYNLGAGFYGGDNFNTITKRLKNKEWDLVPDALYLYRNPGSNVEAGLARRRKAEGEAWKKG